MSILPKPKRPRLRPMNTSASPGTSRLRVRNEEDHGHISYDTRLFVWKRDGGICRHCASATDLQFDHIIPRSRGGSGDAANVELLCGSCNNKKKARLFTPSSGYA